ncbi:hypothetical protein acsn021_26720 [Anaerocolumna cellulosilytica]|uniref:Regulatory protein RecX n=1 Tax=Anaerocolumna cellulosilytica TaxID=433286 RepID=A0A6S6QV25_9FIRM|nr:regulatory protein RecX [Anaerocolumna cellulosilytica]MBB5197578.1 regulatory protein [Anaerocolumna cellulosilytica]BCJ95103.1 hypothetical protein acsn021_26720 [Anaerocolumna cellulosilytica]
MIITKLERIENGKGKIKVYIEGEYCFILYQKDLNNFRIEENTDITETQYEDIYINTVLRRAKQKALAILKYMDRTEQELITKLKQYGCTETLINDVLEYINKYHYIDDYRYAANYIRFRKNSKSKRQISMELSQKGIAKEDIEQAFADEYDEEDTAIKTAIAKKCRNLDILTYEEKQKIAASLYRKGFKMDLIQKYLKHNL